MSEKFSTKNLIYEVARLKEENKKLREELDKLTGKTCGTCKEPCNQDWCVAKEEK